MLIKEYRIVLPFTLDEYKRAQLYMVARVSKENTTNHEGIEIIKNEPYEDENGKGQFTHKIFHIASRIPSFLAYLVPKGSLIVEEKCWNAFPYVKTVYSCSLSDRFSMVIETKYREGPGDRNDLFPDTVPSEKDHVNIVTDPVSSYKYKPEEDPSLYVSKKSERGPLSPNWIETTNPIMCSYKMVSVDFRVFGLQTTVEYYIHSVLREIFLMGHRQCVCWTDEWWDLSMQDIRNFEKETKDALDDLLRGQAEQQNKETATDQSQTNKETATDQSQTNKETATDQSQTNKETATDQSQTNKETATDPTPTNTIPLVSPSDSQ